MESSAACFLARMRSSTPQTITDTSEPAGAAQPMGNRVPGKFRLASQDRGSRAHRMEMALWAKE